MRLYYKHTNYNNGNIKNHSIPAQGADTWLGGFWSWLEKKTKQKSNRKITNLAPNLWASKLSAKKSHLRSDSFPSPTRLDTGKQWLARCYMLLLHSVWPLSIFNTYGLLNAKYRKCFPSHILELKIKSSLRGEWKTPYSGRICSVCMALVLQGSVEASCERSLSTAEFSLQHLTTPGYLSSSFCMTRMSFSLAGCYGDWWGQGFVYVLSLSKWEIALLGRWVMWPLEKFPSLILSPFREEPS